MSRAFPRFQGYDRYAKEGPGSIAYRPASFLALWSLTLVSHSAIVIVLDVFKIDIDIRILQSVNDRHPRSQLLGVGELHVATNEQLRLISLIRRVGFFFHLQFLLGFCYRRSNPRPNRPRILLSGWRCFFWALGGGGG